MPRNRLQTYLPEKTMLGRLNMNEEITAYLDVKGIKNSQQSSYMLLLMNNYQMIGQSIFGHHVLKFRIWDYSINLSSSNLVLVSETSLPPTHATDPRTHSSPFRPLIYSALLPDSPGFPLR